MKATAHYIFNSKYRFLVLSIVLFLISFGFNKLYVSHSSVAREAAQAQQYIQTQQRDFATFLKDTILINRLLLKDESIKELSVLYAKKYGILLYAINEFGEDKLQFWSDQLIVPPTELLAKADGEYFLHLSNGWYYVIKQSIKVKHKLSAGIAFAMIPVWSEFFIETDYLPQEFVFSKSAGKIVRISETETDFPVQTMSGKTIFYLAKRVSVAIPFNDTVTLFFRFAAILFLFLFIHLFVDQIAVQKNIWQSIGILTLILVSVRLTIYIFPQLLNLRQFELFNPIIYGSDLIQRSLGDLLINALLFCWIVFYAWSKLKAKGMLLGGKGIRYKWPVGVMALILLVLSTFKLANIIRSLVSDSKISFDVTNFFSLDRYTIGGFVVLASLSLAYYYLTQLLFRFIFPLLAGRNYLAYFSIGVIGLFYLTILSGNPDVLFYIPVLLWLLIYTWLINRQGILLSRLRINIGGILSWLFIFSVSIAFIMLSENKKVEWEKRKRMADKLSVQTDKSSEMMMSIAIQYLDNEFLQENFERFKDDELGKGFRDSIITDNYRGYLNKYDTRLYVYDENNKPLYNEDPTTYEALNTILTVQSKPTQVDGLYYYETSFDKFNYITRREVVDTAQQKIGSFFIVSNPKNFSNEALFPELFKQFKQTDPENSPIYSIAVYTGRRLISPPGNYPFPIWLTGAEVSQDEIQEKTNGDFDELWYRTGTDKVVVIARKKETFIQAITLFSYLFCSFLIMVAGVQLISFLIKTGTRWQGIRSLFQFTIRTQVHSTIIFISIFSFLVIGAATISFFINRYQLNNSEKLSRTMKIMVNEMEKKMADHKTFDDVIKIYDSVSNTGLQGLVDEVSEIHGVDVNVYDLQGNLQVSSEANVYTKGVLSKMIDPVAYYYLSRLRKVQHLQKEKVGNFSFYSMYSPVRDADGQAYAYINIPYFTSQPELEKEISNFLVTIINLNAFIFLIAGLIALFITNRITDSFSLISDRMKEVNLGKLNEKISWNRKDEIGELVLEYNKMVEKLGESAAALAKSEREGAWREMARQVAHEIKNPLTPMKLSIQYLQKAINNNQPNVKELSSSVANTLVEQIDHLSKIAADFSQFANIGNTHISIFDLHEVIATIKELYAMNERTKLIWEPVHKSIMVQADKTQMNRLFTNLLANAVEACTDINTCMIQIGESKKDNHVLINIKDNGEGIPVEMQERIFIPNFTTKSSGTGLGLAMCKGIVEKAGGKIWFETTQGNGTTFFIELPLVEVAASDIISTT